MSRSTGPQLRSGPVITGPALAGAGTLLALAGLAVGGSHLLSATRALDQGDGSAAGRAGEDQAGTGQGRGPGGYRRLAERAPGP